MTPAEFKTARESLGVSALFIAKRLGVTVGIVWRYESPQRLIDVPERAADLMRDLLVDFELSADFMAEHVKDSEHGAIPRHVDIAEFEAVVPALVGWGQLTQGLLLAEVQRRLRTAIEYVYPGEGAAA
jgi:transcriptional regulator with XRE-family HTH domain